MHWGGWYQNRVLLGVLEVEDALYRWGNRGHVASATAKSGYAYGNTAHGNGSRRSLGGSHEGASHTVAR